MHHVYITIYIIYINFYLFFLCSMFTIYYFTGVFILSLLFIAVTQQISPFCN